MIDTNVKKTVAAQVIKPTHQNRRVQIIKPIPLLGTKVNGAGEMSDEMIADTQAVMTQHSKGYTAIALVEVDKLSAMLKRHKAGEVDDIQTAEAIFETAHELRGQGGSFGYPLISIIAGSLSSLAEGITTIEDDTVEIFSVHIQSLKAILTHDVVGDGGNLGRGVVEALDKAIVKFWQRRGRDILAERKAELES